MKKENTVKFKLELDMKSNLMVGSVDDKDNDPKIEELNHTITKAIQSAFK